MSKKEHSERDKKNAATKQKILDIGVKLWPNVSARKIAKKMGNTHPMVLYHFGDELADAIAAHAVKTGNSKVIAQLIVTGHKAVKKMSQDERAKHLAAL